MACLLRVKIKTLGYELRARSCPSSFVCFWVFLTAELFLTLCYPPQVVSCPLSPQVWAQTPAQAHQCSGRAASRLWVQLWCGGSPRMLGPGRRWGAQTASYAPSRPPSPARHPCSKLPRLHLSGSTLKPTTVNWTQPWRPAMMGHLGCPSVPRTATWNCWQPSRMVGWAPGTLIPATWSLMMMTGQGLGNRLQPQGTQGGRTRTHLWCLS